jgi:ATP-binding cassette subfamily B protein
MNENETTETTTPDTKDKKKTTKEKLKSLREMFTSLAFLLNLYRKYALGFLIATVAFWAMWGPASSLLNVYVSRAVIDKILSHSPYLAIVGTAALIYALQMLLGFATQIFGNIFQAPKSAQIEFRVNREIFEKALATDYKYYDSPGFYTDFTWAAQNLASQLEQARSTLENLIQNFAQFVAMAAYISVVGPWVLVASIAGMLVNAYCQTRSNALWYKMWDERTPHQQRTNYINRMFYTVEPQADLKATNAREYFFNTYDEAADKYVKTTRKFMLRTTIWGFVGNAARQATMVVMIALIIRKVVSGDMADIALYSSLLVASNMLSNALNNIGYLFTDISKVGQYTNRIRKFFDTKSSIEVSENAGAVPDNAPLGVDLDDVSFAYGEVDGVHAPVLAGIDMHIKPGEKVAIVGENGAGKSTIMKLLLRLYDVSSGEIRVGGVPVGEYDVRRLRDRIGIAFQESVVYSLPLAENMQVYRRADDERLRDILSKVGLSKLLNDGAGLDAQLTREFDKDGVMLSGGEMQKFALARLLTGEFGLLILDEPTASLDPLAEYELNKLILDRTRPETTIIVAHRLSTIRDADRIFVVDGGRVVECGCHTELITLGGKYCEMFTKQAENYVKSA